MNALVLEKQADKSVTHSFKTLTVDDLPAGEVLVKVAYSSLNYKDGLAVTNKGRIVFNFPMVPGIDAAGTVVESASAEYQPGDEVILTGWETGERHWGGYAQMLRTQASHLISLPEGWSLHDAMILGTAGFTAMLSVELLKRMGLSPDTEGEVVVTGAAGGVGSVSLAILAELGYPRIVASTGRAHLRDYLLGMGATDLIDRNDLCAPSKKAFESERWAGAIDNVGGDTLSGLLRKMARGSAIALCGLAGGHQLNSTVFPFILRGVHLLGVDSNFCPKPQRQAVWDRLAALMPRDKISSMGQTIGLSQVPAYSNLIVQGQVRGRTVVDVNA